MKKLSCVPRDQFSVASRGDVVTRKLFESILSEEEGHHNTFHLAEKVVHRCGYAVSSQSADDGCADCRKER
jgi:bacterioferritin (cytochrome b1)